jgi:ligand-binding SRPBCC domain-containing protein
VPLIHLETLIAAPIERCFDLARDVEAHLRSTSDTGERAVGGVTQGLLDEGDEVTWEAVHLGVRQRLTARVVRCERPRVLVDVMVRGVFQSFEHTHTFLEEGGRTVMIDDFRYVAPLGPLGRLADVLFLEGYMLRFLSTRSQALKAMAEAGP